MGETGENIIKNLRIEFVTLLIHDFPSTVSFRDDFQQSRKNAQYQSFEIKLFKTQRIKIRNCNHFEIHNN
jgi:hypothetical protein